MRHKTEISNPLRKIRKGYRIIELLQRSLSRYYSYIIIQLHMLIFPNILSDLK